MAMAKEFPHIVVVGGGAGGLELVTRLGDSVGKAGLAKITLVDRSSTHLWKPLLHEIAAGSMDSHAHELDYLAQAHWHHFTFCHGALAAIDRERKLIVVAPIHDENGSEIIPRRELDYDTLIVAIGSVTNDFGVPGVLQNAFRLDHAENAERFHVRLINTCVAKNYAADGARTLDIAIVGGGATGVELAAELHNATRVLAAYGLENFDPARDIRLRLFNADTRILPMLPERISGAITDVLRGLDIDVRCTEQIVEVGADFVRTKSGATFPSDLTVWAAGVRAARRLSGMGGLESNRINQLLVLPTLQTTRDADIFAFGDCAAFPREGQAGFLAPTAQAAHQQASHLARTIKRRLNGLPPLPFHYHDYGSLVSLGEYSTIGSLMGFLPGKGVRVEGFYAKLMYLSLYKMHLMALHGFFKMALDTVAQLIRRRIGPRVKLH
jgi:NADH:ubiquinone reductase (H+-translocating)